MVFPPGCPIFQVALEGVNRAGKSNVRPRNVLRVDQHGFQALRSGTERRLRQLGPEEDMHLMRLQSVHDRQQRTDLDLRQCFFVSLAGGTLLKGLAVLHEPRRHRPEAAPRLYTPTTQQNLPVIVRHATDDDPGILVVDGSTGVADVTRQMVARRDARFDLGAALVAEIHGSIRSISRTKRWAGPMT